MTEADACRAYAVMINTLDASNLIPLLADDFVYESQMVSQALDRQGFIDYIGTKLQAVRARGPAFAELATVQGGRPCVVVAQDRIDALLGVVLPKVAAGKIKRLDMCIIPTPESAIRSGEYPT